MRGPSELSPVLPFRGTPPAIALEARGLTLRRGSRTELDFVDLRLVAGEIVALVGPDNAGISLLLRCLAGAQPLTSGSILWHGEAMGYRPGSRRLLGFVPQFPELQPDLSVTEILLAAARRQGVAEPLARTAALLELCRLGQWSQQLAGRLSKAVQHRVAIARTLVHDPPILLLDGPVGGFDAHSRRWLCDLLRAIRPRTVCCAGLGVPQLEQVVDRVLSLSVGRLTTLDRQTVLGTDESLPVLSRSA